MLTSTTFLLKAPLCNCDEANLEWDVVRTGAYADQYVSFKCKTCKTSLKIPMPQWKANIKFESPYPADKRKAEDETKKKEEGKKAAETKSALRFDPEPS